MADYGYATALSYPEFCLLPRIQRLTNVEALKDDLKAAFGAKEVVIAQYESDWMSSFLKVLDISDTSDLSTPSRIHFSVSDDLAELIRQVNAMQLSEKVRADFLAVIQCCFRTEHNALKLTYAMQSDDDFERKDILARLVPETAGQIELVARLSLWVESAGQTAMETGVN